MRIAALLCITLATGSTATLAQEGEESSGTSTGSQAAPSGEVPSCEDVLRLAPLMTATPGFEDAPLEQKRAILGLWAGCALEARDLAAAYEVLARIAPIAPNPESTYLLLMRLAADLGKGREAVEAFHAWTALNPAGLDTLGRSEIGSLLSQAEDLPDGSEQALRIHDTLVRLEYTPPDPIDRNASLPIAHARLLLQHGRDDEAAQRLDRIDDVAFTTLVGLAADRSFDTVLARWQPIDLRTAAENTVAYARGLIAAHPRRLKAWSRYINALLHAGQNEEALREADSVLAELEKAPGSFDDADEYLNWIHNDRAYALYALGKTREGRAAMQAGIDAGERGGRNVSQVINLALLYSYEGKWNEALETLGSMGQASVYGEMFAATIRVCAAAESRNRAMFAAELAYLRANATQNYAALQQGLICANELDEAAALYIRRLGDASARTGALIALQKWAPDEGKLRLQRDLRRRLEAVQSRPDVQAALAAVGRALEIPFPMAYWGNAY